MTLGHETFGNIRRGIDSVFDTLRISSKDGFLEFHAGAADGGFERLRSRAFGNAAHMLQERVDRLAIHDCNRKDGGWPG